MALPLDLGQELGLEDPTGLQRLGDLAPEEEASPGEVDEDVPDDLPQVHAAAHLLIPDGRGQNLHLFILSSRPLYVNSPESQ